MTDFEPPVGTPATKAQVHSGPSDGNWMSTRDRVREIIQAEVDKFNPTEDARHPLALIVESSVRYSATDGEPSVTVVDDSGHPRTVNRDGHETPFTIRDLLDELRVARPMLFKPASSASAAPDADAGASQPRARDWLTLDPEQTTARPDPAAPLRQRRLLHLRRGRARLHIWTRTARQDWIRPAIAAGTARLGALHRGMPDTIDNVRRAFDRVRPPSAGRGLAVGAVMLATLLGLGILLLSGEDRPAETASAAPSVLEEPTTTGSVSSSQGSDQVAPPVPRTSGRSLQGVPEVLDTATISVEGEVVRLFGVEWAPGAGKPDELTQYLGGREVTCEPAGGNDIYRCRVGEQDLSKVVLFNGGGKTTPEATAELKAAEEKARAAQVGVWKK